MTSQPVSPAIPGAVVRVFSPATGARLGDLRGVSDLSEQIELNREGALSFTYPLDGPDADLLHRDQAFLAVVDDGAVSEDWFALEDDTDDEAAEERIITVGCRGALALLEYAIVYPGTHQAGQTGTALAGQQPFLEYTNRSPGYIVADLINRAKARGALSWLNIDFSGTVDSSGAAWSNATGIKYEAGKDLYTVVTALADNGLCDLRMRGRTLSLYRPSTTLNVDRPSVILRKGRDPERATRKRSRRGIFSHILGVGDGTVLYEGSNSDAVSRFGRREGYDARGGITTQGTLQVLVTKALESTKDAKEGFSLTYNLDGPLGRDGDPLHVPMPGVHFHLGDRIRYDQRRKDPENLEQLRVRGITRTWGGDGRRRCTLTLNDPFVESQIAIKRRVQGIVNNSLSTNPRPLPDSVVDTGVPSTPTGATGYSDVYLRRDGTHRAVVELVWNPVVTNTNGTDCNDLAGYGVSWRVPASSQRWSGETTTTTPEWSRDNLPPGEYFEARIRAFDTTGKWSGIYLIASLTLHEDITPPPPPSAPVVSVRLGVLRIHWDRRTAGGGNMPADLARVHAHMSTENNFTATAANRVGTFEALGAGTVVVPHLTYGQTYYVRLTAVDTNNNVSEATPQVMATITPLVSADLIGQVIAGANLIDLSIDGTAKLAAGSVDTTRLRVGQANLIPDHLYQQDTFRPVRAWQNPDVIEWGNTPAEGRGGHWYARIIGDGYLHHHTAAEDRYPIPIIPGQEYRFAAWVKTSPDFVATSGVRFAVRVRFADGTTVFRAIAGTYKVPTVTGEWQLLEWTWVAYAESVAANPTVQITGLTAGSVYVTQPDFRPVVPGVLIQDGAVTADKVAANSIDALKLQANSVTADKLAAGSVRAQHIAADAITADKIGTGTLRASIVLGARISTSLTTGARVEFGMTGIQAFNSQNKRTFVVNQLGQVEALGSFQAGEDDGPHVRVSGGAWGVLPGLRFNISSDVLAARAPAIFANTSATGAARNGLQMVSHELIANSSGRTEVNLSPDRWFIGHQWGGGAGTSYLEATRDQDLRVHVGTNFPFRFGRDNSFYMGGLVYGTRRVTGGSSAGAGVLNSGFNNNQVWFSWHGDYFRIWVDNTNVASITGDGRFL